MIVLGMDLASTTANEEDADRATRRAAAKLMVDKRGKVDRDVGEEQKRFWNGENFGSDI